MREGEVSVVKLVDVYCDKCGRYLATVRPSPSAQVLCRKCKKWVKAEGSDNRGIRGFNLQGFCSRDRRLRQSAAVHILKAVGIYGLDLRPKGATEPERIEMERRQAEQWDQLTNELLKAGS